MTIADEARDNALHCEMVKYAYRQTKDGVVVSFVVHPNDVPRDLSMSAIGSRWMVALVQLGDDELPITPTAKETSKHSVAHTAKPQLGNSCDLTPDLLSAKLRASEAPPAGAKRSETLAGAVCEAWRRHRPWEEFPPAQQAGMRSGDVKFAIFLEEEYPEHWREFEDSADCIRSICAVKSRSELGNDQRARILWTQLDKHFLAWDAKIRLNA
jgi:hypothetical protein